MTQPPVKPCDTDHDPLRIAIQPVLSPCHCPLVQPAPPEFAYENIMGHSAESLGEVQVDNIHHSLLIQIALTMAKAVFVTLE